MRVKHVRQGRIPSSMTPQVRSFVRLWLQARTFLYMRHSPTHMSRTAPLPIAGLIPNANIYFHPNI